MRVHIAGIFAALVAFSAGPVFAKDIPEGGFTLDDVVSWLQSKGYQAQITTGSDGTKHVSSTTSGVKFGVYMFDCNGGARCGSMQFSAGFSTHGKFDTSAMNEWNRDKRWCRGYFDKDNDPWMEYDIDLSPGGTYENLDDEFATYQKMLGLFMQRYNLQ